MLLSFIQYFHDHQSNKIFVQNRLKRALKMSSFQFFKQLRSLCLVQQILLLSMTQFLFSCTQIELSYRFHVEMNQKV